MNSYNALSQTIWCNKLIINQKTTLFFQEWVMSNIIYVKDLFDNSGKLLKEKEIFDLLTSKRNWIVQYQIIKKVIQRFCRICDVDTTYCKYINIHHIKTIHVRNTKIPINIINSKILYNILVDKIS